MTIAIRRLGPGDEETLACLAREDAAFDLDGRGEALRPLEGDDARRFLADPAVLFWVAEHAGVVSGFLYCLVVPLRSAAGKELLLYEIGVRATARRRGTGRALLDEMERWMRGNGVAEVWVCGDNNVAVEFYRALGFAAPAQPVYMTREL